MNSTTYKKLPMCGLLPGQKGLVAYMTAKGSMRRRLRDIGIIEGTQIECLNKSPLGDPTAYLIRGAVIAIRAEDAQMILMHT